MPRRMQHWDDETDDTLTSHHAANETNEANETSETSEESPLAAFQHTGLDHRRGYYTEKR